MIISNCNKFKQLLLEYNKVVWDKLEMCLVNIETLVKCFNKLFLAVAKWFFILFYSILPARANSGNWPRQTSHEVNKQIHRRKPRYDRNIIICSSSSSGCACVSECVDRRTVVEQEAGDVLYRGRTTVSRGRKTRYVHLAVT